MRLGFVGMPTANKGVGTLTDTVQSLTTRCHSEGLNVILEVVGKSRDAEYAEIEKLLRRAAGRNVQLVMHGQQTSSRVAQLMHQWDVLLHPSLTEGMPIVILEAMAVGLPVVVVDGVLPSEMQAISGVFAPRREDYPSFVAGNLETIRASPVSDVLVKDHKDAAGVFAGLREVSSRGLTIECNRWERWNRFRPARRWLHRHPQLNRVMQSLRKPPDPK